MENWEKEFDEKFVESDVYLSPTDYNEQLLIIKSFISQLLVQKEKEIREKLKKKIEDKKRLKQMWNTDSPSWERIEADRLIYNQAIDDILNLLKVRNK